MGRIITHHAGGVLSRRLGFVVLASALLLLAATSHADKVILRILASHKIDAVQTVSIKSNLPPRVGTNDVINLDGLDLGYDIKSDRYFVYGKIDLAPNTVKEFNVEIRDIWQVNPDEIEMFGEHARQLVAKLEGYDYHESAGGLLAEIATNLASVVALQDRSGIGPGIKPMQHIRAYEANLEVLKRIKTDLGYLENLVLGTGQDVGDLVGDVKEAPLPVGADVPVTDDYRVVVLKISVQNRSLKETRRVSIEKNLPEEIKLQDVVDAGKLEVGTRPGTGICYVYKPDVEVPPGDPLVFDVKMRDKWNLGDLRIPDLRERAEELQARISQDGSFKAVDTAITVLLAELDVVAAAKGPTTFSDKYVAFYRRQDDRLDRIEQKILRVESALRPRTKNTRVGFKVKPPSMKTTWLIIYVILSFLAVMSLLFFLRWYGGKRG